jgi:hypothetical protein
VPAESPYLKPGRLADVLGVLQIMAAGQRPEAKISKWAEDLSRGITPQTERWTAVFEEHPEFFLVYTLPNDPEKKAALRWRYTNKLYDPMTGVKMTQQAKDLLPKAQQDLLTTKPLEGEEIAVLLKTAIELHTRAIEELNARRWWVAPVLGFSGAAFGAILAFVGVYLGLSNKAAAPPRPPTANASEVIGR